MTKEQKDKFERLASALSPENLCCDGELCQSEVNRRLRKYMNEWRQLEQQVDLIQYLTRY